MEEPTFLAPLVESCTLELAAVSLTTVEVSVPREKSEATCWSNWRVLVASITLLVPKMTPDAAGELAYCVVEVVGDASVADVAPPDQSVWVKVEVVVAAEASSGLTAMKSATIKHKPIPMRLFIEIIPQETSALECTRAGQTAYRATLACKVLEIFFCPHRILKEYFLSE